MLRYMPNTTGAGQIIQAARELGLSVESFTESGGRMATVGGEVAHVGRESPTCLSATQCDVIQVRTYYQYYPTTVHQQYD